MLRKVEKRSGSTSKIGSTPKCNRFKGHPLPCLPSVVNVHHRVGELTLHTDNKAHIGITIPVVPLYSIQCTGM